MKRLLLLMAVFTISVGQLIAQFNVTFELNTENIENIDPTGIYIAGGEGFGFPGDNLMTDDDGDGIYTITLERELGFSSHYTFLNGNCGDWSCKEDLGGLPCGDPSSFNDRFLPEVSGNVLIKACYGNCADDGTCDYDVEDIELTFELNTALIDVDPEGIFIAGGGSFGNPGDNPLLDPDGDGIYTATIVKPAGFSSFYTFTNGACPDYSCKENIAGLPCGDPANFNDRFLPSTTVNTTIKACFGTCDNDGSCTVVTDSIELVFELNTETIDVDPAGIFIAGGGNFGNPGDNPMIDPDGDGIYTYTTTRAVGFQSHYTFLNGNCPDWSCKEDLAGLPCGDPNAFNDRFLEAVTENQTILSCFGNCVSDGTCISLSADDIYLDQTIFDIIPKVVVDYAEIRFGQSTMGVQKSITVNDISGNAMLIESHTGDGPYRLNTENFSAGIYIVNVQTQNGVYARKFIVQ